MMGVVGVVSSCTPQAIGGPSMPTPQLEYCTDVVLAKTRPERIKDLCGKRFGRLIVVSMLGRNARNIIVWRCKCVCGQFVNVIGGSLQSGNTSSCGCLKAEVLDRRSTRHGQSRRHKRSGVYSSWTAMIARCTRPTAHKWPEYGGRGIKVCDAWLNFDNFYADMGDRPKGLSLDRIDVEGNYEKSNCRWADAILQAQNHRTQKNNTSGCRGVYVNSTNYSACIGVNGKYKYLGTFPLTPAGFEAAKAARQAAEELYWRRSK